MDDILLKPGSKNTQKLKPEQITNCSPQPPQNDPESETTDIVRSPDSVICNQITPSNVELLDCSLNPNIYNERNTPTPYLDFGLSEFWNAPDAVNFEFSTPTSHFLHTPDLRPIILPALTSHLSPEKISPRLWQPENQPLSYTILE